MLRPLSFNVRSSSAAQTPSRSPTRSKPSYLTDTILAAEDHSRLLRYVKHIDLEEAVEATDQMHLEEGNYSYDPAVQAKLAIKAYHALPLAFNRFIHDDLESADLEYKSLQIRSRIRTIAVGLVVCLNIGVEPFDVIKTKPCAATECWIDLKSTDPLRTMTAIGNNLEKQYRLWLPKGQYHQKLDPQVEEIKRLAISLRKNARTDRVLFHYNGHGVPKPTPNGEIWVFNADLTKYVPLSMYDLLKWIKTPSIFVYDCSQAGLILKNFEIFAHGHETEFYQELKRRSFVPANAKPPISIRNCIQLGACSEGQNLPTNPLLPADLFTCCLTTPIKTALRWHVMEKHDKLAPKVTLDMIDKIPGTFNNRVSMLGELNWIFTAVTDTIASDRLPRGVFHHLFRQDPLVASLFRNFILADRLMKSYDCTPVSQPALPENMHQHIMWKVWDYTVDTSLAQLSNILEFGVQYKTSSFFEDQLTSFEIWLRVGDEKHPPKQLPILLQILLSQTHRLRALNLLGQFLQHGKWAVNLALLVGLFPYVLKLLQSEEIELAPYLVSIWARVLSVDSTCKADLVKDNYHRYFISTLQNESLETKFRIWSVFILSSVCGEGRKVQEDMNSYRLVQICLKYLNEPDFLFRQWAAITIGRAWDTYETAKMKGLKHDAPRKLYDLLNDPMPEVRASAVYALGTFFRSWNDRNERHSLFDKKIALKMISELYRDASPMVRKEFILVLRNVVCVFESDFFSVCREALEEYVAINDLFEHLRKQSIFSSTSLSVENVRPNSRRLLEITASLLDSTHPNPFFSKIFEAINFLANDPEPIVSWMAKEILLYLFMKVESKKRVRQLVVPEAVLRPLPLPPIEVMKECFGDSIPSIYTPNQPETAGGAEEENASNGPKPPRLETDFNQICLRTFTKHVMKHECRTCDCDPESASHCSKDWMYKRNLQVKAEAQSQRVWLEASWCKFDHLVESFKVPFSAYLVAFNPFAPQIAVAGEDEILVRNLDDSSTLCTIRLALDPLNEHLSRTPIKPRFTDMTYINSHDNPLFTAATNDGALRVYKDRQDQNEARLVTAWKGLHELTPLNAITEKRDVKIAWAQRAQTLAIGGSLDVIRLWDTSAERAGLDIFTRCHASYLTSLSFSTIQTHLLASGFSNGSVMVFDIRTNNGGGVQHYTNNSLHTPILDCKLQGPGGFPEHLVFGSQDGKIKIVDTRVPDTCLNTISLKESVRAMSIHQRAFTAAGMNTKTLNVSVYSLLEEKNRRPLNSIKTYGGIFEVPKSSCGELAYHPHLLQLATAYSDGNVNVYNMRKITK